MKPDRKTRGDCVLGTLPTPRQQAIYAHGSSHTLAQTVAWLAADGLVVSEDQVSKFLAAQRLSRRLDRNASTVESLLADLKKERPGIKQEELDAAGQMFFTALSVEQEDADSFVKVRSSRSKAILEQEKLALRKETEARHQRKLEFDKQKFLESLKSKIQAGLDAIMAEAGKNPKVKAAVDAINAATEEKKS